MAAWDSFACHTDSASLQLDTNAFPAVCVFLSRSRHNCVNFCKGAINSTSICSRKPSKDLSWNFKLRTEQNLPQRPKTLKTLLYFISFGSKKSIFMSYIHTPHFKTKLSWFSDKAHSRLLLFFFFFRLGDWNACRFCPAALPLLGETSIWQSIELWVQRSNTPQGTIKGLHCFTKVIITSCRGCFYLANSVFYTLISYCGTTQCPMWPDFRFGWTLLWDTSSLSHQLYKSVSDYLRQNCSFSGGAVIRGSFTTTNRPFCFVVP